MSRGLDLPYQLIVSSLLAGSCQLLGSGLRVAIGSSSISGRHVVLGRWMGLLLRAAAVASAVVSAVDPGKCLDPHLELAGCVHS